MLDEKLLLSRNESESTSRDVLCQSTASGGALG